MQRTNFIFLGTLIGTITLWFLNKGGETSFFRFHERDCNGNDLEDHLNELMRSILQSLDCVQCDDRTLAACWKNVVADCRKPK